MSFGLITFTIAAFEAAVALARGVADIRQPERQTVPGANMVRAHIYAEAINEIIQQLYYQFDPTRWPILVATDARMIVAAAAEAASRFENETRQLLPVSPSQSEVHALTGGLAALWVTKLRIAQEALEIIAGERPFQGSTFEAMGEGRAETILVMLPYIGDCVLIYEAVAGRSVVGRRNLSNAERVAAALGVALPIIANYSVRLVVRAAAPVITVTRRAVIFALDDLRVSSILATARRLPRAVEIAAGLRALPEGQFNELRNLVAAGRQGALSASQVARLNYFFVRMYDLSRLAQWLRIIETELGSSFTGLQKLKNVSFSPGEEQALTMLAQKSGDPVVKLPEVLPMDYPGQAQVAGVTHPDAIWRGEMLDILVLRTASINNAVGEIGKKSLQASTVVVALLQDAKLASSDIDAALPRIWGNPRYVGISRVATLDAGGLAVHVRPDILTLPLMAGLARIGLGDPKRLAQIVEALQAEPPEPPRP
jgi:hypothetical protein